MDSPARYVSKLTRLSRSNFFVSFLFLPKRKRNAIYAVYAFCRVVDDSVDEAPDADTRNRELNRWKRYLEDAYQGRAAHPVMMQLMHAIQVFDLPKEYFLALIEGVEMDLTYARYSTFEELQRYCYRVASVVGLLCIKVFGYKDAGIPRYAENLGMALQCTNILRDVGKDAMKGRIYLPQEDLQRFGVSEQDVLEGRMTEAFKKLMEFECARAEDFYRKAQEAWKESELRTLFPAVIMKTVYHRLLKKIRHCGYDVYSKDLSLSSGLKLFIATRIFLKALIAKRPPL